jgi:hypothetical protein
MLHKYTSNYLRPLIVLILLLEIIGIYLHLKELALLKAIVNESYVASREINQISDLSYWQLLLYLGVYFFAGLFFIRWGYLSPPKLVGEQRIKTLKEPLFLGLIPFANLFKPLQYILGFLLVQEDHKSLGNYRKFITIWWTLWLISGPLGRALAYFIFPQENLEQSYFYLLWYIFIEWLALLTGLLLLMILRRQLKIFKG